jgi:hypothetical protein
VPRLVPPPRPLAWREAAASCLRENAVAASLGGSFADGSAEIALEGLRARVRVWPSLKISATGPQAERDRALEVLAGAGFVEGWSPGATGKMRAWMPAEHEDAPDDYGMTGGPSRPTEGRTLLRTHPAIDRPADKGGDALRSALRTLRDLPPSPKPSRPAGDPAIEVLAERCYEAWRGHFGGVDPCNGIEISPWTDILENERRAWRALRCARDPYPDRGPDNVSQPTPLSILVTGGTGSFGKKFAEIAIRELRPRRLIVFSRDELKQHDMRNTGYDAPCLRYFIGDVRE